MLIQTSKEIPFPTNDELTRFLVKVKAPTENHTKADCLIWGGGKAKAGYGIFNLGFSKNSLSYYAHRLSYSWFKGQIPKHQHIHHTCGNRACVKPSHLEVMCQAVHNNMERAQGNWGNQNTVKTHCINGHEFTEDTTCTKYGFRRCLTCHPPKDYTRRK